MTGEACAAALLSLFERGLIEFSSNETEDLTTRSQVREMLARYLSLRAPQDSRWFRLETSEMRAQRRERHRHRGLEVSFSMTTLGGATWERLAQPDWGRILVEWTNDPFTPEAVCEIFSPDIDLIMARMGWFPELTRTSVVFDTVTFEKLADHQILYWKRLPSVSRTTFSLEDAEPRWGYLAPKWFQDWWSSSDHWYKAPWELPGWPPQ